VSDCPTGPFKKFDGNPILIRRGHLAGVGHHSFLRVADGTLCCAYHCHNVYSDNFKPRMFCLNTAEFVESENGIDKLVINGPTTSSNLTI
jgi:hypothetical protein